MCAHNVVAVWYFGRQCGNYGHPLSVLLGTLLHYLVLSMCGVCTTLNTQAHRCAQRESFYMNVCHVNYAAVAGDECFLGYMYYITCTGTVPSMVELALAHFKNTLLY